MQSPMNPSFLAYLAFSNRSTRLFHSSDNGKYHPRSQAAHQSPRLHKLTISTHSQLPNNYIENSKH